MATAYDCKFIETSVAINHNTDELLVGLLTQIRLKLENPEKSRWAKAFDTLTELNLMNFDVFLSFHRRRHNQRPVQKAFLQKIKETRMFTFRRHNMFIRQRRHQPKHTGGTLCHWYKYSPKQHPEQVNFDIIYRVNWRFIVVSFLFCSFFPLQPPEVSWIENFCVFKGERALGACLGSRFQIKKLREPSRAVNQSIIYPPAETLSRRLSADFLRLAKCFLLVRYFWLRVIFGV